MSKPCPTCEIDEDELNVDIAFAMRVMARWHQAEQLIDQLGSVLGHDDNCSATSEHYEQKKAVLAAYEDYRALPSVHEGRVTRLVPMTEGQERADQ